jgi:hypothetical protein
MPGISYLSDEFLHHLAIILASVTVTTGETFENRDRPLKSARNDPARILLKFQEHARPTIRVSTKKIYSSHPPNTGAWPQSNCLRSFPAQKRIARDGA